MTAMIEKGLMKDSSQGFPAVFILLSRYGVSSDFLSFQVVIKREKKSCSFEQLFLRPTSEYFKLTGIFKFCLHIVFE